MMNKQMHF